MQKSTIFCAITTALLLALLIGASTYLGAKVPEVHHDIPKEDQEHEQNGELTLQIDTVGGEDASVTQKSDGPLLLALERESVPVKRQGKVVSYKTSYSGHIRVGTPAAQTFSVVFDTGSGHIILPSVQCETETCTKHNRYNSSLSAKAVPINVDGSPVPPDELCDQATIGFGTGQVTGEFVRDQVCLGPEGSAGACLDMQIVVGVEMTPQPFKSFNFDGIIGLGLNSLALSDDFSFLGMLGKRDVSADTHFGVFLTEGENGEESEIAFGGHNTQRLLQPLHWTPVTMPEAGYWQVQILAFRIDGKPLDVCEDGTCRGVMDTGTSHLGIPGLVSASVSEQLTEAAGELADCREVKGSTIEIEIPGFNITLTPENYMRKLPLEEGVNVGSSTGVTLEQPKPEASSTEVAKVDNDDGPKPSWCRPRFMPVNLPEPLGPKLFILGEPVLHKYYSVYDWKQKQVGIGLAASRRNLALSGASGDSNLLGLDGDVTNMLQQTLVVKRRRKVAKKAKGSEEVASFESLDGEDEAYLVQVTVSVKVAAQC